MIRIYYPKGSIKREDEFIKQKIGSILKGKRILDAGGGIGSLKRLQKDKELNLDKRDLEKIERLDINPDKNPDIVADLHDMSVIADRTFDGIISIEVFGQLRNPIKVVNEFYRILKPGGKVFLTSPFMYPYSYHHPPKKTEKVNDYYRYSHAAWVQLFKKFKTIEIMKLGNYADVTTSFITGFKVRRTSFIYRFIRKSFEIFMGCFVKKGVLFENTCLGHAVFAVK